MTTTPDSDPALNGFDPLRYLADAFGTDTRAASWHYTNHGIAEGRSGTSFNPFQYIASNPDLVAAFGTDTEAASRHYITYGYREGRRITIDRQPGSLDDFTDNTATTGRLTVGGTAGGVTEKEFDNDWFAVTLEKGSTHQFGVDTGVACSILRLYDREGHRVTTSSYQPQTIETFLHSPQITAETTGTYYLEYDPESGPDRVSTGPYTVWARRVATDPDFSDDFGNSPGTAGHLPMNGTVSGSIDRKFDIINRNVDEDWFAVSLQQGHEYTFDTSYSGSNFYFALSDEINQLVLVERSETSNGHIVRTHTANMAGTFYIKVECHDLASYTIRATDNGMADDIANDASTAASLAIGGSARGHMDYRPSDGQEGDSDWFAVSLQAGQSYDFDLQREGDGAGLLLKDAQGRTVSGTTPPEVYWPTLHNYTKGQDSLHHTPAASGTYYLTVNSLEGLTGTDLAGYTVSARLSQGSAMLAAGGW